MKLKYFLSTSLPFILGLGLLLALLLPVAHIAAQGSSAQSWVELVAQGVPVSVPPGGANGPQASPQGLTYYTDRGTFDGDNPGLPIEDFEEGNVGPGGVVTCPAPVNSSSSGPCFAPGEILPGVSFENDPIPTPDGMVILGPGVIGNSSIVLGPNFFADNYNIDFDPPVDAAGMDLYSNSTTPVSVEIYAADDTTLLDTTNSNISGSGVFWGVASTAPIGRIRIVSPNGELVDDFAFGVSAAPGIAIEKTASPSTVTTNGIVTFTITVSNTGDIDLDNVNVSDPLVPVCDNAIGALVVSATITYDCSDKPTSSYTNVVTVTSQLATGAPGPSATASAAVTYTSPTSVSLSGFGENPVAFPLVMFAVILTLVVSVGYVIRRKETA